MKGTAMVVCCILFTAFVTSAATSGVSLLTSGAGLKENSGQREPLQTLRSAPAGWFSDEKSRDDLVEYARKTLMARLGLIPPPLPPRLLLERQHGCFVTFFSDRKVIACFGGFLPRTANIASEIEENVRMALLHDSRARFIAPKTARACRVQVTFPGMPVPVKSYREIDPLREGMLVENRERGIAIVPGEAKTSSWAFREAMRRLGETDPSGVRISRFAAFAVSDRAGQVAADIGR